MVFQVKLMTNSSMFLEDLSDYQDSQYNCKILMSLDKNFPILFNGYWAVD